MALDLDVTCMARTRRRYAGGIVSAAVDGLRVADAWLAQAEASPVARAARAEGGAAARG